MISLSTSSIASLSSSEGRGIPCPSPAAFLSGGPSACSETPHWLSAQSHPWPQSSPSRASSWDAGLRCAWSMTLCSVRPIRGYGSEWMRKWKRGESGAALPPHTAFPMYLHHPHLHHWLEIPVWPADRKKESGKASERESIIIIIIIIIIHRNYYIYSKF